MKLKIVAFMVISLIGSLLFYYKTSLSAQPENLITVYQSRTCGCCKKWVAHLQRNGFAVESVMLDDVSPVKEKLGVPKNLVSCHTASVRGLIIEGHVPASAIKTFLNDPKNNRGIAVPGMPIGSPGMEGSYVEKYDVISFSNNNTQSSFMTFN